jgi:hydroxymethylpyrimidine pyrophosphatase-like HAD family hydrolase
LQFLAEMHRIPREQVAAIGDSYNDLDMLQYAGIGVAVANARQEIKEAASIVTESNLNNGVAVFINDYLAKHKEETCE